MALKKSITVDKGIIVNYFRIASITQNFINQEPVLDIYVYGYADESYRLEEKEIADDFVQTIVTYKSYYLPFDDVKGYSREAIYNRLKEEVEDFIDAEDC